MNAYLLASFSLLTLVSCQSQLSTSEGDTASPLQLAESRVSSYRVPASSGVEDLVRYALKHHPAIDAARARVTRLEQQAPQLESLPDPSAKVGMGSMGKLADGKVDFTLGVDQSVPFPGKRKARGAAARKEAEAARANLHLLELQIAERVRMAWWDYYLAHRTIAITRETRELLETINQMVESRVSAASATQSELLRVSTEIGKVDQALIEAKQQRSSAQSNLNGLLNRPSGSSLPQPSKQRAASTKELTALIARAESRHPSVREAEAKLGAFRQRLKLAQLNRYPDFSVGLSGLTKGRDEVFPSIGMSIPLWQAPRKAQLLEAKAGISEAQATIGANRSELRSRVEDAWFRAQSSRDMISLFDQRIIPDSEQAFSLSLKSYASSEASFVDVLDTWRQLLSYQLQQEQNHASLGRASAALKSAAALR